MDPWSIDADEDDAGAWAEPTNTPRESHPEPPRRRARPAPPPEDLADDLTDEPLTEEERVAEMLGALPQGAQVAVYRTAPTWAAGHLQTISMHAGDHFDLTRLDDLAAYWGGGHYRFRPMVGGKFLRGGRTLTIDGPTLYQGRPHPNDPRRHQRLDIIDTTATLPAPLAQPQQQGGPYIIRDGQAVDVMGQLLTRLGDRLDRMEARLSGPTAAVDPMGQVQGALSLLAAIRDFDRRGQVAEPEEDDEDEDEDEEEPHDTRSMIEKLILKKLEGPGGFLDDGPPPPATAPAPATTGPRLIRASEAASTAPPAPAARPAPAAAPPGFPQPQPPPAAQPPAPDPAQMLAWFRSQPPAAQAALFHSVGDQLGPEATAELGKLLAR